MGRLVISGSEFFLFPRGGAAEAPRATNKENAELAKTLAPRFYVCRERSRPGEQVASHVTTAPRWKHLEGC